MKKKTKIILGVIAAVTAALLLTVGILHTRKPKNTVAASSFSDDGKYELILQNVGKPDRPFGISRAELLLQEGDQTVSRCSFEADNGGEPLGKKNLSVQWAEDCVRATVFCPGQPDALYTLYFDGASSSGSPVTRTDSPEQTEKDTVLRQEAPIRQLAYSVRENRENELVFDFSADDYIDSYNGYYYRDHQKRYILPRTFDNWTEQTLSESFHAPYETLMTEYSEDRKFWSLPTISVLIPPESSFVQEIIVNFDWHSYADYLYDLYGEMCFYTVKIMLPELSDEEIENLCAEINKSGYDHVFSSEEWYSKDSVPYALYYKDNVGIYSHFAIGTRQKLCIIPVTEETVEEFRQKGAEIVKIGEHTEP